MPTTTPPRPRIVARPVAHLLALAPLDVWLRMLAGSGGVAPRYWLRLAGCLFTSWVGTVVTMPERLLLWPVRLALFGGSRPVFRHDAGVVVVLGYYRSGTTHLHNLLACDRRVVTPRWYQCLAGQGWWVGWGVVRLMLTPFLGSTRPQDGVGFGPAWPAEDDFAVATWGGASTLAGRFVFPSPRVWRRERAWHGLDLDDRRLRRWRSLTAMFCWKITRLRRGRVLVLKTPSHTARVAELDALFAGRARFVSIERDDGPVIDSNLAMHRSLAAHALQDIPDEAELRVRIEVELAETRARRDAELARVDPGRVVRVRYDDLAADPMGQMERVCRATGCPWDETARRAVAAYLHRVGRYRGRLPAGLPPDPEPEAGVSRPWLAAAAAIAAALAFGAVWLGLVWVTNRQFGWQQRFDSLAWLAGGVVGAAAARAGRVGSPLLGAVAALATLLVHWGLSFPVTVVNWNYAGGTGLWDEWWHHNSKGAIAGVTAHSSLVFGALGAVTAWRQAARRGPRAPGTSGW